jgi:hypothetical protein
MKQMKVYTVYWEDGTNVYKSTVPAWSKKEVERYIAGNGDIVKITESELQDIDCNYLANTLCQAGWGEMEIDVIIRTLQMCGLER